MTLFKLGSYVSLHSHSIYEGYKHVNLVQIIPVVIEIRGVELSSSHPCSVSMSFLATGTQLCVLIQLTIYVAI